MSYDLEKFFEDANDDNKLLATVRNEFSEFNCHKVETDDPWYSISRIVLSDNNYRVLLMKIRLLQDDILKKNFPFYYEKCDQVSDALNKWV